MVTGCGTSCRNDSILSEIERSKCLGINCCQTTIPYNLKSYSMNLTSLERQLVGADGVCGWAFLVDENSDVSSISLAGNISYVPISLLWTLTQRDFSQISCCLYSGEVRVEVDVGNGNSVTSYKCNNNNDNNNDYEGNPYIRDGCKVSGECQGCISRGGSCVYDNGSYPNEDGIMVGSERNMTCAYFSRPSYKNYERKKSAGVILVASALASSLRTTNAQLDSCETSCGGLAIEFPFGSKEGCYHSPDFFVSCNRSFGQPLLFLGGSNLVITNMSTKESDLEIMMFVATNCYNNTGLVEGFDGYLTLGGDLRISTKNRFVAIGCDTLAIISGGRGTKDLVAITGCISYCVSNTGGITNGACSGVGCCQVPIPQGINSFNITINSFKNHTDILDFNPCSYGFVVAPNKFNFSTNNLHDFGSVRMPMLLEWAIGNASCEVARKNDSTNFLCKGNSECDKEYDGPGYRCRCTIGYAGNPYIENSCTNINECEDGNNGGCEHECVDRPGSYECRCQKGYKNDGKGCIADELQIQIVIGISIGMGVLFLMAIGYALYKVIKKVKAKRRRKRFFKRNGGLLLKQQEEADPSFFDKNIQFTSRELEKATYYFNENRILGRGGQGTVYKGMLGDGRIVAVKKSKVVNESQLEQFINEVVILSQVNHRNVVKLLGCCLETEVPLLVSEFIPNGTLYDRIHNVTDEFPISWNMRLQIATEVAGAVAYLHSATSVPIYHRDIKTTNILLDDKHRAKVSDFGTSRFVSMDQTHLTTLVKGTFGYLDPEYFQSSQFTEKSDVYSFGVVLVELLTGEVPISLTRFGENRSLATHFMLAMEEGRVMSIIDAIVIKEGTREEILAVANLAMRCLNLNGKNRPTMKEVVAELEAIRVSHVPSMVQTNFQQVMQAEELQMIRYGESTSTFMSVEDTFSQ